MKSFTNNVFRTLPLFASITSIIQPLEFPDQKCYCTKLKIMVAVWMPYCFIHHCNCLNVCHVPSSILYSSIFIFWFLLRKNKTSTHGEWWGYLGESVTDMAYFYFTKVLNCRGNSATVTIFSIRAWTHPLLRSSHESARCPPPWLHHPFHDVPYDIIYLLLNASLLHVQLFNLQLL